MLFRKINVQVVNYKAFTLVESLLSLLLGTLLLFSLAQLVSHFYIAQHQQNILFNLQKQSEQIITYFKQNIQHMHYQGNFRQSSNYELFNAQGKNYLLENSCLIFFYDLNGDGCIGNRHKTLACVSKQRNETKEISKEFFGFKFEQKAIYVFEDKGIDNCIGRSCLNYLTNCQTGNWRKMSDLSDYFVEKLAFKWKRINELIEIELQLYSTKSPDVKYSVTAYVYIMNRE